MDHSPSASIGRPDIVQKVTRRLFPFVGICYLIAYIDRQNVSFAKRQMVGDLGLSDTLMALVRRSSSSATFCSRCRATCSWRTSGRAVVRADHDLLGARYHRAGLYAERRDVLYPAIPPWRLEAGSFPVSCMS